MNELLAGLIHIVPVGDLREHITTEPCWCDPSPYANDRGELRLVHNALDGRD